MVNLLNLINLIIPNTKNVPSNSNYLCGMSQKKILKLSGTLYISWPSVGMFLLNGQLAPSENKKHENRQLVGIADNYFTSQL